MDAALHSESMLSRSRMWSVVAGVYTFAIGIMITDFLSDFLRVLGNAIGLPSTYALVIFAAPALIFGAITWWIVVERRASYSYRFGALFGLITALLTGMVWTTRFIHFWGLEMVVVPVIAFLVVLVLGIASVAGVLAGLPLMYARRRFASVLVE